VRNTNYLEQTAGRGRGLLAAMATGARTPEELETLLEDAVLVRDADALAGLFEAGAVVALGVEATEARGEEIAGAVAGLWEREIGYLAEPRRVLQTRDVALIVADGAISVVHRDADRRWRYAIALLTPDPTITKGPIP
jgi:hypothetical protein